MTVIIPESHKDLLEKPVAVTLCTVSSDCKPYASVVWRDFDGQHIRIVTSKDTRKFKNVQANPYVTVLALDPQNPYRYLEIAGVVEFVKDEGVMPVLDKLTMDCMGKAHYFGDVEPAEGANKYRGVVLMIKPTRVVRLT